jgi:ferredoxin-type protein NapH
VPLLATFFGKRWYCSWVCGCGGLANTAGDPLRHLTSKSSAAWRFEKVSIHTVLGLTLALTALLFITWGVNGRYPSLAHFTSGFQSIYGFIVVAMLEGVIGALPAGRNTDLVPQFLSHGCDARPGPEIRALPDHR